MATVKATCPDCGDVELTTRDMTVRICTDDESGAYTFRCPACAMTVLKEADPHIVDLLAASGVQVVVWAMPAELAERPHNAPLFTHDDLLDFHHLLNSGQDWFAELADPAEE